MGGEGGPLKAVCHAISGAHSVMVGWCEGGDVETHITKHTSIRRSNAFNFGSGGDADGGPRDPPRVVD